MQVLSPVLWSLLQSTSWIPSPSFHSHCLPPVLSFILSCPRVFSSAFWCVVVLHSIFLRYRWGPSLVCSKPFGSWVTVLHEWAPKRSYRGIAGPQWFDFSYQPPPPPPRIPLIHSVLSSLQAKHSTECHTHVPFLYLFLCPAQTSCLNLIF